MLRVVYRQEILMKTRRKLDSNLIFEAKLNRWLAWRPAGVFLLNHVARLIFSKEHNPGGDEKQFQ